MAKQVQFRRGSNTENDTFTGAVGEITVDTTTNSLRVHDGTTAGGTTLGSYTKPSAEPISYITGLQTALDGKIDDSQVLTDVPLNALFTDTIGLAVDGDGSQLTNLPASSMGGTMTAHILPDTTETYDIGSAEYKIRHLFLSDNSLWVGDDHKVSVAGGKQRTKKRKKGKIPTLILDTLVGTAPKPFPTDADLKAKFKIDIHDPAPDPTVDPEHADFQPLIHQWLHFAIINGMAGIANPENIFDSDDFEEDVATETVYTLDPSVSTIINPANGGIQSITLTDATNFTESLEDGQSIVLMISNGLTHLIGFPTTKWVTSAGNVAPTLTDSSTVVMWKVGSTLYGAYVGSYV